MAGIEQGFGLAFAVGGIVTGFIADRISPRWLYPMVLLGWSTRRLRDRLGHELPRAAGLPGAAGFLRGRAVALRLVTAQRLLSRRDRPLGNSIIQSGASLGAIATPIVVLLLATDSTESWRLPFRVIGAAGVALGRRLAGGRSIATTCSSTTSALPELGADETLVRGAHAGRPLATSISAEARHSFAGSSPWRSS